MSLERVFKALVSLGLSQLDARVYIFLATKGSKKARKVAATLEINRQQVYRIMKRLQNRGIIIVKNEHPAEFSALPFEEALNLLMKVKEKKAQALQEEKEKLLSSWKILLKKNSRK